MVGGAPTTTPRRLDRLQKLAPLDAVRAVMFEAGVLFSQPRYAESTGRSRRQPALSP